MTPRLARLLKAEADAEAPAVNIEIARLKRMYARRADMRAALAVFDQQLAAEELKQSRALGYFVPLRGQQLLEAMGRQGA